MSTWASEITLSLVAQADLHAKQFYAVNIDTGNVATAAKNCDGILQDTPVSGQAGNVAVFGKSKATISDTVTAGQRLEIASGGTLVPVASGTAVAKALEAGASGDVISVLILKSNAAFA